jgi:hypothetical protein
MKTKSAFFILSLLFFTKIYAETGFSTGYSIENAQKIPLSPEKTKKSPQQILLQNTQKSSRGVFQQSVIASELGFFPEIITATQGTPLKLFITSISKKRPLCFILETTEVLGGNQSFIRRQLNLGEIQEVLFTPEKAGLFSFYCPINHASGSLIVKESTSK